MSSSFRREISNPAQLRALASPARQELVDLLARTGPATAAALGRLIGRPADGLYYHLRALERAGLVRSGIARTRAGRGERVFRAAHREPALRHDPGPGGNSPAVASIVAAMLRLGIRDFRKACASPDVRTRGPRRELWALRVAGRLSPSELADANRRMRSLRDALGRRRAKGDLYAVTILITPLGHRARKKQRRPRRPDGRSRP
ncbi:MAG TPA: helix-turn-helix domain-containing protein [Candidatus Eisenbacteria bacterium]